MSTADAQDKIIKSMAMIEYLIACDQDDVLCPRAQEGLHWILRSVSDELHQALEVLVDARD